MIEPTKDVLRAILALSRSNEPAWIVFMSWLNQSFLQQAAAGLALKGDVESRWSQGRCQELSSQINIINNVEAILASIIKGEEENSINMSKVID